MKDAFQCECDQLSLKYINRLIEEIESGKKHKGMATEF